MEIRYVIKVVVIFHGDIQHSISHSKQGKKDAPLIEELLYDPCRDKSLESYQDPTNQMIP